MNLEGWVCRVPSKTFFIGEYSVLFGGAALVLATSPHFEFRALARGHSGPPFHSQSLAGRFYQDHRELLGAYEISQSDPHQNKGGFGGSSAELIALIALRQQLSSEGPSRLDPGGCFNQFRQICQHHGIRASGADLMAQVAGGITYFKAEPFTVGVRKWQLDQLDFVLIRTGHKVPTHWHVRDLKPFDTTLNDGLVHDALSAIERRSARDLVAAVREYRQWMFTSGFEDSRTTDLISELASTETCLTAKGCGAMGADVVLALVSRDHRQRLLNWAQDRRLRVVATADSLVAGAESYL